jgi:hypothetical protein
MALVKALNGEIRVVDGIHSFTVGTEPQEIPDALVDAAVSQGCQLVGEKATKPAAPKAPAKQAGKSDEPKDI